MRDHGLRKQVVRTCRLRLDIVVVVLSGNDVLSKKRPWKRSLKKIQTSKRLTHFILSPISTSSTSSTPLPLHNPDIPSSFVRHTYKRQSQNIPHAFSGIRRSASPGPYYLRWRWRSFLLGLGSGRSKSVLLPWTANLHTNQSHRASVRVPNFSQRV